ncbi:hypothetical protein DFJ73DRAFT_884876 [Zopfochytrium polystomum]|nr:hypothetical protein DFJ73DRAFT_884876 [Zopfochytrium polystomum]
MERRTTRVGGGGGFGGHGLTVVGLEGYPSSGAYINLGLVTVAAVAAVAALVSFLVRR